jgi:Uma2 family endonuclease
MVALNYYISPEDYLEGERLSPIKHEYRRGSIYAMGGAKKPHVIIASNFVTQLNLHLAESLCLVLSSDIKIRLLEADCYYYPDVVVTCDPEDIQGSEDFIHAPKLIVEILSKSTAKFDRTEKFIDYQTCPQLEEYVLVSQTEPHIEVRTRQGNQWQTAIYQSGDRIYLKSIDWSSPTETLYQKVFRLNPDAAAIP